MFIKLMEIMSEIGCEDRLTNTEYRIFFYITKILKPNTIKIETTLREVAKQLKVKESAISRAFRGLNKKDIVRKNKSWFINPHYLYKGNEKERIDSIAYWDTLPESKYSEGLINLNNYIESINNAETN